MRKGDVRLKLGGIPVRFFGGEKAVATSEGNNAAWHCQCGELLVGRCYFQFGHDCHVVCEVCGAAYRVEGDAKKRAVCVRQFSILGPTNAAESATTPPGSFA